MPDIFFGITFFDFSTSNVNVKYLMLWNENASDVNLSITLMGIRFDVDVIVINAQYSSGNCVVATHTIPDLNFLAILDECLKSCSEAHNAPLILNSNNRLMSPGSD